MIGAMRDFWNRFLGRGDATIAVPLFDGALKPNQKLEAAETILECAAPEDLATDGHKSISLTGRGSVRLDGTAATEVRSFDRPISALAVLPNDGLAVALAGREVRIFSEPSAAKAYAVFATDLTAVNALAPGADGELIATRLRHARRRAVGLGPVGTRAQRPRPRARSGNRIDEDADQRPGLRVRRTRDGRRVLVSESWLHRLVAVGRDGSTKIVLPHLPVYPSRLSQASGGGSG